MDEQPGTDAVPRLAKAVDAQEFTVTWKGYDREEVRSYLAEIESELRSFEAWASHMRARLSIAEEKSAAIDDVDRAMVAVFEAKERVLQKARLRAERIEAEARQRARTQAEEEAATVVAEAREEVRRIAARTLAEVRPMRDEPERNTITSTTTSWPEKPGGLLPEPSYESVGSESVHQLLVEMEGVRLELENPEEASIGLDEDDGPILHDDGEKQSLYERTSADLPSMGDDPSVSLRLVQRLRDRFRRP